MGYNNCKNCDHFTSNTDSDLHCYMFKTEPDDLCWKHTKIDKDRREMDRWIRKGKRATAE